VMDIKTHRELTGLLRLLNYTCQILLK
jgi:hypothetical protein